MTLLEFPQENLLLHFSRNGSRDDLLVLERGDGVHVWDTAGNRYFDGLSSLFCAQLGYGHAGEMAAIAAAQISELPFSTTWGGAHPRALELAARVAGLAPPGLDHVFFTSGGSESVETAWKLVRQFHLANGEPGRVKAIARDRAYHGVTLGALAFTGVPGVKEPFGRPAIDVTHVSNTNSFRSSSADLCGSLLAEMESAIVAADPSTVAMVIAEPVQNAGGALQPPPGYWPGLRTLCDRYGILLVADEVITGFGRLGEWFGVTRFGAVPDLITCAKGLTSAYAPMGAVVVSSRVATAFFEAGVMLQHGITFGGHPLSAALALGSIDIFEREGVLGNVRALEGYLGSSLASLLRYPMVGDVRGSGFFWALELVSPTAEDGRFTAPERESLLRGFLPGALRRAGLIARGDDRGDTALMLAPPLVCTAADLDELVSRVADVIEACSRHMGIPLS